MRKLIIAACVAAAGVAANAGPVTLKPVDFTGDNVADGAVVEICDSSPVPVCSTRTWAEVNSDGEVLSRQDWINASGNLYGLGQWNLPKMSFVTGKGVVSDFQELAQAVFHLPDSPFSVQPNEGFWVEPFPAAANAGLIGAYFYQPNTVFGHSVFNPNDFPGSLFRGFVSKDGAFGTEVVPGGVQPVSAPGTLTLAFAGLAAAGGVVALRRRREEESKPDAAPALAA
jgi:MYXO-CTERM domain-containing protein